MSPRSNVYMLSNACPMPDVDLHLPPIVEMSASDSKSSSRLDLGHGWPTFADAAATSSHRGHGGSIAHEVHDEGSNVAGEQKPEECCAGLEFMASLFLVVRAVCEAVGGGVRMVGAAMDSEFGGQNNTCDEGEDDGKGIHSSYHNCDSQTFDEGRRKTIEQNYP